MNYINNIIHSDCVFFPLWIGVGGCIAWAWWSESTNIFSAITKSQLNVNTVSPSNDSVSTIVPHGFHRNYYHNFEERIHAAIQRDLERDHSNIDSIKTSENISILNENISKFKWTII